MRTFTKSFLTFLLLFVAGALSAQGLKVILEQDYSKLDAYPYYWMGDRVDNNPDQPNFCSGTATVQVTEGALRIENTQEQGNNWDLQPFVLDWFNTTEGEDYVIRFWLKSDVDGTANLSVGTWGTSGNATLEFKASDDYQIYSINHTAAVTSTGNDEHILFQMGKVVGTVYIQKVQILQMGEDKPILSEHGDWVPMINNSDMEGDDVSSFFTKVAKGDPLPSVITDGVGVDGSRGIIIEATEKKSDAWDNQFWFRFNEPVEANTKYRVSFDYKADAEATVSTQAHAEPSDYIYYELFGNLTFTNDWQTYTNEASVTSQQSTSSKKFLSVAFNLNELADANNYYFDNISFDVYVPGIDVQFSEAGIQILFPYYTNIVRLVAKGANGKNRLMMPTDCFKVLVEGQEAPIESVEADITGKLMVFLDEDYALKNLSENSKVVVIFTNPEDATFRLTHIDTNDGEAVENFEIEAYYNAELDILPYTYGVPSLMSSEPENGSFNLPNTLSEFKLVFDKEVDCEKIEATLGNEKLKVETTGFAEEVILKRTGTAPLEDGEYKLLINKVYGKMNLGDLDFAKFEIKFSIGAKESEELRAAINDATAVKDENDSQRYHGEAFTALVEALTKYEAEIASYTAPSVIDAAIIDLNAKVKAVKNHRTLVDEYDSNNEAIQDIVTNYEDSKYNTTELYLQLKAVAAKYEGKELTDDEELQAAVDELKGVVSQGKDMFTEGVSNDGDAGFKVLLDRIRLGIETLTALGVPESDEVIVAGQASLTDDDDVVNAMKSRITKEIYEKIKNGKTDELFVEETNGEGEIFFKGVDMSVFIKDPNMYALLPKNGINMENTPGWSVVMGNPGLYGSGGGSWGTPRNVEGLPEDCAFTTYHSVARMEQTIEDLPAGIYTVTLIGTDWGNMKGNDGEGPDAEGFVYCKTSDTPAVEEGQEEDRDNNFAATATIEYAGEYQMNRPHDMTDIAVTDGKLTLGVHFGGDSQYFFGRAQLTLTEIAQGFDYAKAYETIVNSVETAKSNKVRALQLYDLNGRRINKAQKGVVIVKKMMSDGTIRAEKVVK